jgi:ribulose 1,5-bisphosphate synthetase/thiazole synthase
MKHLLLSCLLATSTTLAGPVVRESAREIPVAYQADVVVVGGTTYGVAAATAAAKAGAKVFLIASHTYLGEDVAGTLRLWDADGKFTTPLDLKRNLDTVLIGAKVEFLLSSFATDLLRDDAGNLCGVVMANRAGRQAVLAKVVVDATMEALVARIAGLPVKPRPDHGEWRVIGGAAQPGAKTITLPATVSAAPAKKGAAPIRDLNCHVYDLKLPLTDDSWAARATAEQLARDLTYDAKQLYASEFPYWPPTEVTGKLARLYRAVAEPEKVGAAAAAEAKTLSATKGASVVRQLAEPSAGEVKELLAGVRTFTGAAKVSQPAGALPVIGQYDVVVVGGGTSGGCAGIGAARQGAKTLVIEYLHGLGGVGTEGLIGKYYAGNRVGFTKDIPPNPVEVRKQWYRYELRQAGADIWFGTLGCGAFVENGRVKGVVVATPFGRGVVLAKNVVDSTGSSDTAIAAGAAYKFVDENDVAVQGTGLPGKNLGANYTNTDFTFADDTDPLNIRAIFVSARKSGGAFDVGQLIDTRERRRIVGEFVIDPLDEINGRTYPDSIVQCGSNFDSHGYTIHPYFTLVPPTKSGIKSFVPYRSLVPKGLDGVLVTGLGISAHRDAMPPIRMQADLHNQGYAAGVAAAMAAKAGVGVRSVDVPALQKHLVEIGNLPASVLTDKDSFPPSKEQVATAVASLANDYDGAALVMWEPATARPLLRAAYAKANGPAQLIYAHTLAMLGDATGVTLLQEAVGATDWDKGWNFHGMGQFGASRSKLDSMVQALGYTKDKRALPVLIAKAQQLTAASEFSHCRAVAVAVEQMPDPAAASALVEALGKVAGNRGDRNVALKEVTLARALFRCGDKEGIARRILEGYTRDTRGPFAQHAAAVLAQSAPK